MNSEPPAELISFFVFSVSKGISLSLLANLILTLHVIEIIRRDRMRHALR